MTETQKATEETEVDSTQEKLRINDWTPELQSLIEQDPALIAEERSGVIRPCKWVSENFIGTLLVGQLHDDIVRFHQSRGIRLPKCFQIPTEILNNQPLFFLNHDGKIATRDSGFIAPKMLVKKAFGHKAALIVEGPLSGLLVIQRKNSEGDLVWGLERVLNDTRTSEVTFYPNKPRAGDISETFQSGEQYQRYQAEVSTVIQDKYREELEKAEWTSEVLLSLLKNSGIELPKFIQVNRPEYQTLANKLQIYVEAVRSANISHEISEEELREFLTHISPGLPLLVVTQDEFSELAHAGTTTLVLGEKSNPWVVTLAEKKDHSGLIVKYKLFRATSTPQPS